MKKILYLICAASLLTGGLTSCKDDEPEVVKPNGGLIYTEEGAVIRFYLSNLTSSTLNGDTEAEFTFVDPAEERMLTFSGKVRSVGNQIVEGQTDALECDMLLGEKRLPDGHYFVRILIGGEEHFGPFYVSVLDNSISPDKGAVYTYSQLQGEGSKENPYRISDSTDFEYFIASLNQDPNSGYGQYFELTEDIALPSYTDNPRLTGARFQGTLNGNNHRVSALRYDGLKNPASAVSGLFSRLFNAEITDLLLSNVELSGLHAGGGALAGETKGKVTLRNVSIDGNIEGELNTGGLIGVVEGELHLFGIRIDMNVKGGDRTGGVVGAFSHEGTGVSEFNDVEVRGEVSGTRYTGGLIGLLKGTKAPKIGGVTLRTHIKGTENVGGFVGMMDKCMLEMTSDCLFDGVGNPVYSIEGVSNVGGYVGMVDLNAKEYLLLDSHVMNLNVALHASQGNAGGVVGLARTGHIKVHKVNLAYEKAIVESEGDCVGGMVGRMEGVYLSAGNSINIKKQLPQPTSYKPHASLTVRGGNYVGGIVGYGEMTEWGDPVLDRGKISGIVSGADVAATGEIVGGVAGWYMGEMADCVFIGKVKGRSDALIGGVIGKGQGRVDVYRCVNYSDIEGGRYQGGICGYSNPTKVFDFDWGNYYTNCYNIGNLSEGKTVGGIVGYGGQHNGGCDFRIRECENYGTIMAAGDGDHSVGGIIGDLDSDKAIVEWSANYSDVGSRNVQFVIGGVVGKIGRDQIAQNDVHVTGCTNLGTITCDKSSTKLGGVVGHLMYGGAGIVSGCVNWGSIPGDQKSDTGGILGCATSFNYIHRNWNRGKVSHGNAIVGTHPGATTFDHYGNYYLKGSGGNWPSAIEITESEMTHTSKFPQLTWGPNADYFGYTGEWYQMSTEGPIPMSFDFIHWDVERLRPAGWHVDR